MAPWTALAPAAPPWTCDRVFVPEPDALNPFGGHDASRAKLTVHFRDVHTVTQARFTCHQSGHFFRVVCFVLEVRLQRQPLADVRDQSVEGDIEQFAVDESDDSIDGCQSMILPAFMSSNMVETHLKAHRSHSSCC